MTPEEVGKLANRDKNHCLETAQYDSGKFAERSYRVSPALQVLSMGAWPPGLYPVVATLTGWTPILSGWRGQICPRDSCW